MDANYIVGKLIDNVPSLMAALLALLSWLRSRKNAGKIQTLAGDVAHGNAQVVELKKNTDGMQTALLDLKGTSEHAEGVEEGRQLAVDERQARVIESERVEDRTEAKAAPPKEPAS